MKVFLATRLYDHGGEEVLSVHASVGSALATCANDPSTVVDDHRVDTFPVLGHGDWTPRGTPVKAYGGELFWVVNEDGVVEVARWNAYWGEVGCFQSLGHNDEGMCGFTVTHYQPIFKPDAP